jgi:hypothetical protein
MHLNIFKKIYLFFVYRKNLLKSNIDLKLQFNIRIDNVFRFYTVLNIPEEYFEEPYNIRKSDIEAISSNYIKNFNDRITLFLNSRGLTELYKLYDIEKVDKYSYLFIFGYSLLDTRRIMMNFIYTLITLFIILLVLIPILLYAF